MSQLAEHDLRPIISLLAGGTCLSVAQAETAFDRILHGQATPAQIGGLLMAMRVRGETCDEIVGAVRSMRSQMVSIRGPQNAIDTCGTGGDGLHTLNVSTAVAFVVAACGVPVAKHGNRAQSSRCGAADVLEALGVNIDVPLETVETCLRDIGIGFLFSARHHAATQHVGQSRRELGTRTIFNLLGPLSNPAGTRRHLLGVFSPQWLMPFATVLRSFGCERAWVVHGEDGMDELTTTARTQVADLQTDGSIGYFDVGPEDIGLDRAVPEDLRGGDAAYNAAAFRRLLDGVPSAYHDIVVLNSAAALVVAGIASDLPGGAVMARDAIASGTAMSKLDHLVRMTNSVAACI